MIQGYNNSNNTVDVFFDDYVPDMGAGSADGHVTMDDIINGLEERRNNVLNGGINCIPLPFDRFRNEVPGIEQEQYVVVTAGTKCGKTQLASFVYLYHPLDYAFEHPDQCSVHIIYFSLEESETRVRQRYISHLLFKLYGYRLSPSDLRSTDADFPLPEEVLVKMRSPEMKKRLDFFDKCVQFETEDTNPTGILRVCEDYAKSVGEYRSVKKKSRGDSSHEVNAFLSYTPHDKNHYMICFLDHISLVDVERGMTTKQAIDKTSEYFTKYLRNRFGYTVVCIQQQAMENEGLEAIKMKKMIPAVATLGDSKYSARDGNMVLGLFDPSNFGLQSWLGYKINDPTTGEGLKNYGRFLYMLRGRDGEAGGVCPLFFDGATCNFEELPLPTDPDVGKYYFKASKIKSFKQQKKASTFKALTLTSLFRIFNGKRQ